VTAELGASKVDGVKPVPLVSSVKMVKPGLAGRLECPVGVE
jgi:hypothetical protein